MAERNLSARALYYMAAQVSANVVGVFTASVLARAFTKGQMGDYQQLWTLYSLFSGILIMGLPQSLTYFYAVVEERQRAATVYFVTGLLFLLGLVLGLVTCIAAPFAGRFFNNDNLASLVRNFFMFYAFTMGGSYLRRLSVVTNRYLFLMFWLPFDRVLMLLSFAAPALMGYGLETTVKVAVWVAGAKFAITTAYTMYIVPVRDFHWAKGLAARILYYSIPLGLSAGVSTISAQIDRLVIGHFTTPEFYAVFSLGAIPIPLVPEIAESVMTVLIPVLAKLHAEKNNLQFALLWQESVRKSALFILAIFGFVEFFAVPVAVALYGPGYAESATYFRIYQLGLLFRVTMYGSVIQALGKTRQILYVMLVVVAVKPFTNVALYRMFEAASPGSGPMGPPLGSILLAFMTAVYYTLFVKSILGVRLGVIWPWASYGKILAASVLAGLAAYPAAHVPDGIITAALVGRLQRFAANQSAIALLRLAMGAVIFLPVYALLLHVFRALKDKDWELLKDMTYRRFTKRRRPEAATERAPVQ